MGEQAILPKNRKLACVQDMGVGQSAWIVPWTISADVNDRDKLWLNMGYAIEPVPFGTFDVLLMRKEDGFWVDLSRSSYQWSPKEVRGDWRGVPIVGFMNAGGG